MIRSREATHSFTNRHKRDTTETNFANPPLTWPTRKGANNGFGGVDQKNRQSKKNSNREAARGAQRKHIRQMAQQVFDVSCQGDRLTKMDERLSGPAATSRPVWWLAHEHGRRRHYDNKRRRPASKVARGQPQEFSRPVGQPVECSGRGLAIRRRGQSAWSVPKWGSALASALVITLLTHQTAPAESVDCFKCSSRNGSNPACEDPFHNLNTTRVTMPILPDPQPSVIYHTPCYAGRKNRDGLFPASACIKLTGVFDTTGETLVVRHCALDSGSLTQDTELARMSHCGKFQFEGDLLRGCVLACPEDACNGTPPTSALVGRTMGATLALLLLSLVSSLVLFNRI